MSFLSRRCRSLGAVVAMAALMTFSVAACGGGGGADGDSQETIYVHVFNGYPGSQSLSLYGPSGRVVTGLPFGERTEEPVAIDRNYGSEFTLVLDGAPQPFPLQEDLFSFYPQETVTFFVAQRQDASVSVRSFRHIQSISPACRLVLNNSLALQSAGLGQYAFLPGFNYEGIIPASGYDESLEENALDPEDQRPELYSAIAEFPYFALVEAEGEEEEPASSGALTPVWIGPEDATDANIDYESGTLISYSPSVEYINCIEEQEEAESEEEEVDCNAPTTYNAESYDPGEEDVTRWLNYYPETFSNSAGDCSTEFQIFSDFDNIFTGEHGFDGYTENQRVQFAPEFGISDHFIFVLYGRPVDPKIESWIASDPESGGGFVEFDTLPGGE